MTCNSSLRHTLPAAMCGIRILLSRKFEWKAHIPIIAIPGSILLDHHHHPFDRQFPHQIMARNLRPGHQNLTQLRFRVVHDLFFSEC